MWSHWQNFPKCAILVQLYNIRPKITFHFMVLIAVLVVCNVTVASLNPILLHGNRSQLVHIHLNHVPYFLCWSCICVHDKNSLYFELSISLLSCLTDIWSPVWASLGSFMKLMTLPHVPVHMYYPGICLLHHHHWIHHQDLHMATNMTLAHMLTYCLQKILGRYLFWLLQDIFPNNYSQMVLTWW